MNATMATSVPLPIIDKTVGILMSNIGTTLIRSTDAIREIGFMIRSAKESAIIRTNIPPANGASVVIPTINMTVECDIFAELLKAIHSQRYEEDREQRSCDEQAYCVRCISACFQRSFREQGWEWAKLPEQLVLSPRPGASGRPQSVNSGMTTFIDRSDFNNCPAME
jgi:hypothetical protein